MDVLLINEIMIDWSKISRESYLRDIPSLRNISEIELHMPVTFFAGENGTGKSTLLEAVAVSYGFNPEGGTRNYSFSTYDSHSELHNAVRLSKGVYRAEWGYFFRAESFYNVATMDEMYGRGYGKSHNYHERSHGESFLDLFQDNFRERSLYILDEPEAALSPQRQLTLLLEIYNMAKNHSQFLVATHSPILLGMPGAEILCFDENGIHPCEYEDTESYKVTSAFIKNKDGLLKRLLCEEESEDE